MMEKEPETLVTDQDKATIKAFEEMKGDVKTLHMYDSWHFLRTLGFKGIQSNNKSKAFKSYSKLLFAEDEIQYKRILL